MRAYTLCIRKHIFTIQVNIYIPLQI